jgi:hypothetical protein
LSFKTILIQKPQISIFGKYLNLFELKNVFDLNFNFGFKFKTAEKKFQKLSYFSGGPNRFRPNSSLGPFSSFHRLPPSASIGTAAPPAAPPCYALPTAALLHARRAKPKVVMPPSHPPLNRHCLVSSFPFNSFKTNGD